MAVNRRIHRRLVMRSRRFLTYMPGPYGIRAYTIPRNEAYLSEHAESLPDSGKPSVLKDLILQALPIVSKKRARRFGNPADRSLLGGRGPPTSEPVLTSSGSQRSDAAARRPERGLRAEIRPAYPPHAKACGARH